MQGNLNDFKPCHRIAAAKELLRRGFDNSPDHTNDEYEDHDESFDHDPGSPNHVVPDAHLYNTEDDPFDFDNYDEEQFIRDRDGERALSVTSTAAKKPSQSPMKPSPGTGNRPFSTKATFPTATSPRLKTPSMTLVAKATTGTTPCASSLTITSPSGSPTGSVEEFKKRMAEYDGPKDRPSCCYPGWSRDYALAAVRKSFEYPDRVEPQPDQTAENTDTGESQLVQSPEDPDPGNSESREPNRAKDPPPSVILERSHVILSEAEGPPAPKPPPRQSTPKIYPGSPADDPPADGPRERRDPGDIRIPLRNLLSVSAGPL